MKKFRTKMKETFKGGLCLALAVCMMLCMFPAVGAEETETTTAPTYEYVFTRDATGLTSTEEADYNIDSLMNKGFNLNSSVSTGVWEPVGRRGGSSYRVFAGGYRFSVKDTVASDAHLLGGNGSLFKIKVKETGVYQPSIKYFKYRGGSKVNLYLCAEEMGTSNASNYINKVSEGTIDVLFSDSINTYEEDIKDEWSEEQKKEKNFETVNINLEKDKEYYLVVAIDGANTQNYYTEKGEVTDDYSREFYYQLYSFGLDKVDIESEEPETVTAPISFVATSNVGEGDMMNVEGFTYDEFTDSIPAGTYVTVTPKGYTGYEFKHWVRGSADNGVYVSDNPTYSFTALTHTFLTAIYENVSNEDDGTATVEFYNGNGQYLDKAVSTVGGTVAIPDNAKAPAMTGFEFANQWKTENGIFDATTPLVKKLTRAVAQFNTPSTTFTVTCGDEEIPLTYGSEHTFTSNNPVYWLRDETVVGYGASYTHAAWNTTEITTSETGELVPVVLLDATTKDGAYMIEYNAAGKEILEVGIVFGGEDVSIGSCSSKATSQYKNQHGQFTAKPYRTETHARGYLIYKDTDNTYKVVYSK